MKGWKKERYRRQKLRKAAQYRKQLAYDLDIWCSRFITAQTQCYYYQKFIESYDHRQKRGDLVKSTKESNPPHQD